MSEESFNLSLVSSHNERVALDSPLTHTQNDVERRYQQSLEDLNYARSIQSMMAPTAAQLDALFPQCMVYDRPMDKLSGDFLFVAEQDQMAYLAACDCTGHGMSAALMTVLAREKLWQALSKASGPAHLLTRLDEKFRAAMMNGDTHAMRAVGMGLDLAVIAYQPAQQQLRFAGAKRPLWIVRNGKLLEFKGTSRSIGGAYWRQQPFVETTLADASGRFGLHVLGRGVRPVWRSLRPQTEAQRPAHADFVARRVAPRGPARIHQDVVDVVARRFAGDRRPVAAFLPGSDLGGMKKALPLFLAAVVAGAVVAWSMYNKPHKDYAQEEVAQTWRAEDLVAAFAEAPDDMQAQWQEKVVEVTGTVRSSSMQGVVLNPGVVATYDEGHAPEVRPRGR